MTSVHPSTYAPARPESTITSSTWRVTVLTSRLIRIEWHPSGEFVDAPTQVVHSRSFPAVSFDIDEGGAADSGGGAEAPRAIRLTTEHVALDYDGREFSPAGLTMRVRQATGVPHGATWHFGDPLRVGAVFGGNLMGTTRTLDEVDGATDLDPGLLSMTGFSVVDDSQSLLLDGQGWVYPRPEGGKDLYIFAYGLDHHAALRDFFTLAGRSPLLPRYVLGNWWSRYWAYSDTEYLALMDSFTDSEVPFSVGVVDMDWHLVDIDPELGSGWTGYTWNRDLFPDPAAFLADLHRRGMSIALNVHPADGVRRHEEAYDDMAVAMGQDPTTGKDIPFDIANPDFVRAYFDVLHHRLEDQGVDFWWIDWQQGTTSHIPGLDPLWMLGYQHYADSARERGPALVNDEPSPALDTDSTARRPLIFSRYAGLGSHRYPVGFSGDTITTWESLDFQPYFTATAANVGYYWWSHDIGGHMFGYADNELETRWFQLGVFSPINRLHSSNSPFMDKDPSRLPEPHASVMKAFLRLRHRLVPYVYTAMWRSYTDGVGPIRPLYHDYPLERAAYVHPNQFAFGPDIIVAPITRPMDAESQLGSAEAWIPPGEWTDFFTGEVYSGPRHARLYRPIGQYPVLVRAGSAVVVAMDPMAPVDQAPDELVVRVTPGTGRSLLIEDDGSVDPTPEIVTIDVEVPREGGGGSVSINGLGAGRRVWIDLVGVEWARARVGGRDLETGPTGDELVAPALRIDVGVIDEGGTRGCLVELSEVRCAQEPMEKVGFDILQRAQIGIDLKGRALEALTSLSGAALVAQLDALDLPSSVARALTELAANR